MKKILTFALIAAIALPTVISAAPGGSEDPIVTLSYLNQQIDKLKQEYDRKINSMESSGGGYSLDVVELPANGRIIAQAGTEIILRGGKAFAITTDQGGLSNVTNGTDIPNNGTIPANNLLIVPRSDGRGVYTNEGAIFIVRGDYTVE